MEPAFFMQNPPHILIVDDEPHITCLLSKRLTKAGYSVATAFNGEEALLAAADHPPDLVLSDYQMPDFDGLSLAKELFKRPGTEATPILMLTARGHKIDDATLEGTNIWEIIPKPYSGRQIEKLVEQALSPIGAEALPAVRNPFDRDA